MASRSVSIIINTMNKQKQLIHLLRHWWDRILASDPGLTRLNQGIKVISSVISTVFIMLIFVHFFAPKQLTSAIFSGVIGMMGILVVNDDTEKEKMITTLLLPLSSGIAIVIGSYLSSLDLSDAALIVIIFLAFYLQKFGFRYFSLCMIAFMSIYFSALLHVKASQLPWLLTAIAVGTLSAFVYNFFIFKDRPKRVLERCLSSFHKQTNLTFNIVMEVIEDVRTNRFRQKSLQRNVSKLNEYARMVAGELGSTDPALIWPGIKAHQLRLYVFDTEMLLETLYPAVARLKSLHALENDAIRKALYNVIRSLRDMEVLEDQEENAQLREAEQAVEALQQQLDQMNFDKKQTKDWLYLVRRIESITSHVIDGARSLQEARKRNLEEENKDSSSEEKTDDHNNEDENNEKKGGMRNQRKKPFKRFWLVLCRSSSGIFFLLPISTGFFFQRLSFFWERNPSGGQ